MTNNNRSRIFILADRAIQWSLKRVCPRCTIVPDLKSLNECFDIDFICVQIDSGRNIQEFLWEKIRMQGQRLSPVIVMGPQREDGFVSMPENLVFEERPHEYRYLSLPISLGDFLGALSTMQPLYDRRTLKSHVRRYASTEGLIGIHLHNAKNMIRRDELEGCVGEFDRIEKLLLMSSGHHEIRKEITGFKKNPTLMEAEHLINYLSRMFNGQ